ncbi:MAG: GNAT family N-acetyltransferase [Terracoccus sp.]
MTTWDPEAVLAASSEWTWVPERTPHVRTSEYLVVAYPEHFLAPTGVRVFGSDRDPAELADEVAGIAAGWGRERVWLHLSDSTHPPGLEAELLERGAEVVDRADVLALPLPDGVPDLAVPTDVEVRRVTDEQTLRDVHTVSDDAFGATAPVTRDQLREGLAEIARGFDDDSVGRFVAYVDGRPAGCGGWTLAGEVCRLWGGATHTDVRGRGAYRAVLAARLETAAVAGATLGLTHGRVETSSPILRRIGFVRYGEERTLRLDLPAVPGGTS